MGIMTLSISEFEAKLGEAKLQMRETARVGGRSLGAGAGGLGGLVTGGLVAAAAAAAAFGVASMKMAATWDASMEQVHTQAGASQREVDSLKGAVLRLAPAVGTGPQQLAEALYHVESVGLRGKAAMDALTASAKLAKVGHADLEATSSALAAAFVTQAKDTKDVNQAAGILNATIGVGNMRMQDMVSALSTGLLPVAKDVGLGLTDVGAALAVATDRGMRADEAATRLRMTLSLVTAPTDKAKKALQDMGLSAFSLAADLRKPDGLSFMLHDLHDHLQKLSQDKQAADLSAIFGGGRSSALIHTLLNGISAYDTKLADIKRHSHDFGEAWRATAHQAAFQWDQLKAGAQSFMIQVGNYLIPRMLEFGKHIQSFVGPQLKGLISTFEHNKTAIGAWATLIGGAVLLALRGLVMAIELVIQWTGAMSRAWGKTVGFMVEASRLLVDGIMSAISGMLHGLGHAFSFLHLGIGKSLKAAGDQVDQWRNTVDAKMQKVQDAAFGFGEGIGKNLAKGLRSQRAAVAAAAASLAKAATPAAAASATGTLRQARFQHGGILTEPVVGVGLRSGIQYTLAERGAEAVTPLQGGGGMAIGGGRGGGGGGVTNVNVYISAGGILLGTPDEVASKLEPALRRTFMQLGLRNWTIFSGQGIRG